MSKKKNPELLPGLAAVICDDGDLRGFHNVNAAWNQAEKELAVVTKLVALAKFHHGGGGLWCNAMLRRTQCPDCRLVARLGRVVKDAKSRTYLAGGR